MIERRLNQPIMDMNEPVTMANSSEKYQVKYFSLNKKNKCKLCKTVIKMNAISICNNAKNEWYDMDCFRDLKANLGSDFNCES